jgi:hypothetical protein
MFNSLICLFLHDKRVSRMTFLTAWLSITLAA